MENKVKDITIFYDNYGNYYISKIDAMDIGLCKRTGDIWGYLETDKEQIKKLKENPGFKIIGNYILYICFNEEDVSYISTADAKALDLPNTNEELVYYKLSTTQCSELSKNQQLQLNRELRLEHEKERWIYDKNTNTMLLYALKEPNWSQEQVQKSTQEKTSCKTPLFDMRLFLPEEILKKFGIIDTFDSWPEEKQIKIQQALQKYYFKIYIKNYFSNQRTEAAEENNIAMGR